MSRNNIYLALFIILKFALQFILLSPEYELQRDEFLHLDQANHLAWGYLSVPPVTSWLSLIIKLLGNSVFWVKFFPALFGALTIVIVWKIIEELKGNTFDLRRHLCFVFSPAAIKYTLSTQFIGYFVLDHFLLLGYKVH